MPPYRRDSYMYIAPPALINLCRRYRLMNIHRQGRYSSQAENLHLLGLVETCLHNPPQDMYGLNQLLSS